MTHIDLLPYSLRRRWCVLGAIRTWAVAALIVTCLSAAAVWIERDRLQQITDALELREQQYRPIVTKQAEIRDILKQLESLKSREAVAYALEDRHPALTLLGTVGQAAKKTNGRLQIQRLSFDRATARDQAVAMNGQVIDHQALAHFLAALRGSNLFVSVDPTWVKAADHGDSTLQIFEVKCLF